jgi:predicted negative regulator of RcsB-dependent stress response
MDPSMPNVHTQSHKKWRVFLFIASILVLGALGWLIYSRNQPSKAPQNLNQKEAVLEEVREKSPPLSEEERTAAMDEFSKENTDAGVSGEAKADLINALGSQKEE